MPRRTGISLLTPVHRGFASNFPSSTHPAAANTARRSKPPATPGDSSPPPPRRRAHRHLRQTEPQTRPRQPSDKIATGRFRAVKNQTPATQEFLLRNPLLPARAAPSGLPAKVDAPRTRRHSQKRSCHIETPDPPTEGAPTAPNGPRVFSKISYPQGIQAAAPSQASLLWHLTQKATAKRAARRPRPTTSFLGQPHASGEILQGRLDRGNGGGGRQDGFIR